MTLRRIKEKSAIALFSILLFGGALRLLHISFGLPAINDPDELMFELGAIKMLREHSLDPGWFGHPATTTMYVLALVNAGAATIGLLGGWFSSIGAFATAAFLNPTWLVLPGRIAMAMFGLATIWFTFKLGRELFDKRVGLIGALLVATSPVAIAWGQVIRSDIMATAFMEISLLACLRYLRLQRQRDCALAAIWLGIAIATKWPFGLSGIAMMAVLLLRARDGTLPATRAIRVAIAFWGMTLVSLVLTSPYLVLSWPVVLKNLSGEAQLQHLGATGGTPLENLWWYLRNPLLRGMGITGELLSIIGLWAALRSREARIILLPVLIAFLLVLCRQHLIWERWAIPLLPLLSILAGAAVVWLASTLPQSTRGALCCAIAGIIATPLVVADIEQARARNNDTRQRAAAWAIAHIPAGNRVMIEHFGFDLYQQPWTIIFPLGDMGCVDAKALLRGKIGYGAIDRARAGRSNIDFGTIASSQSDSCHTDYAILTQYDRYAAERKIFPEEYRKYAKLLKGAQIVATFSPLRGQSSGPVTRIASFPQPLRKNHGGNGCISANCTTHLDEK